MTNVQIIFNPFRLKPLDEVLPAAEAAGVAIFARVPLASGLLSGRYTADTVFAPEDHRAYNRHGEAFDQGETFSGIDYATGVAAAAEFAGLAPEGATPAATALRIECGIPSISQRRTPVTVRIRKIQPEMKTAPRAACHV